MSQASTTGRPEKERKQKIKPDGSWNDIFVFLESNEA
jgi:hypothetical protein